jgi:ceramide glucosyltransferase
MWRGKRFRVGLDMKVVEIKDGGKAGGSTPELERARSRSKDRQD